MELSRNAYLGELVKGFSLCETGGVTLSIMSVHSEIIHGTWRDRRWRYSVASTQPADHSLPAVASKTPHKNCKLLSAFVTKKSNGNSEVTVPARGKHKFPWCYWDICGKGSGWTLLGQWSTTKGHFPPNSQPPLPRTNRWPAAQTRAIRGGKRPLQ